MSAQLSESENAFFQSGGTDEKAITMLRQETGIAETPEEVIEVPRGTPEPKEPKAAEPAKELEDKPIPDVKFVPLEALQEERAEKKQLRQELEQFKQWQAGVQEQLKRLPVAEQAQVPDPNTDPFGYQQWALGQLANGVQDMQTWREQQESTRKASEQTQRVMNWAQQQASVFATQQPEFNDAYTFAKEGRTKELLAIGYAPEAVSSALEAEQAQLIMYAAQSGKNPAQLVYDYAKARGFTSKAAAALGDPNAAQKIAQGQAQAPKLNKGGQTADGEMTANDLANIKDPVEFEKQWNKVFGKKGR